MGYIPIEMLYPLQLDESVRRQPEEIGGFQRFYEFTAMRVVRRASDGVFVYHGEEGPLIVDKNASRELRDSADKSFSWWRFEVYSEEKNCPIDSGDSLVMADYPPSMKRVHVAPFKKGFVNNRPDPSSTEMFESESDAIGWVDGLKRDYFYTKSGAVAAFSRPGGILDLADARNYPRNQASRLVLGVCEDLVSFKAQLLESDFVQELLMIVTEKKIQLGPKKVKSKEYEQYPIQLSQVIIDESYSLMDTAIVQALAGPQIDSDKWLGEPVLKKVDYLFRDHLHNKYREYLTVKKRSSDREIDGL